MANRVLRAPMNYFETTPLGRILNRFTYDVEVLDVELSVSMTGLVVSCSWLISAVVVMILVVPWITIGIVPVAAIPKALKQAVLKQKDIDLIELNEAFATQSLKYVGTVES